MQFQEEKLKQIDAQLTGILEKLCACKTQYKKELAGVHPLFKKSALNLIHYLAFRSFNIDNLQTQLRELGLPSLSNIEAHVMQSLLSAKTIVNHLCGKPVIEEQKGIVSITESEKLLRKNTKQLFRHKSKNRRTLIMVTLPDSAAEDKSLLDELLKSGMNSVRINCAHNDEKIWKKMIENVRQSEVQNKKKCSIMMDLGGAKIRTGMMKEGPRVMRINPKLDERGSLISPAKIWIAPPDIYPPDDSADNIIPVEEGWFQRIKRGNTIKFQDSRGKACKIIVHKSQDGGKWGFCKETAYITSSTELILHKQKITGKEIVKVGGLLPLKEVIVLKPGEYLQLHKNPDPGEPALLNAEGQLIKNAHISCTNPQVFADVKKGEPVFFDDGKIEGIVEANDREQLLIRITQAKESGSKLKPDKGINFPESKLQTERLSEKDKKDLHFVLRNADAVNLSFANEVQDVQDVLGCLKNHEKQTGLILKIETKKGFKNLPLLLLCAMQAYPVGVMVARGDLAIETGWKNFASIQEEILRICEAAHVPDIWATQVLETLVKRGVPTRAEITDVAMAQRAECIMLNKGFYISKAVKMLDKILRRMQHFQKKKETMLPKLVDAQTLQLSHDQFNQ